MGKKPLSGARNLFWVGLALACLTGLGCSGSGPRKPLGQGSLRENPYARPPGFGNPPGNPPGGASDFNKTPPPPPPGIGNGLSGMGTTDPLKSPLTNTSERPPIMKTSGTTTSGTSPGGLGGFEQGSQVPVNALPGNTDTEPAPLLPPGNGAGFKSGASEVLPPVPTLPPGGSQTANFGQTAPGKTPAPIATGNPPLPPPPPSPPAPVAIPGAALPPGSDPASLPPLPGTAVGTTAGYPPTDRATPPPPTPPGGYPGGALPGEVLPPVREPQL